VFFKELKSTLRFAQYELREFESVEGWVDLAVTSFLYLERYRAIQLAREDLSGKEKSWWEHQRTHGLCRAVRSASEQNELTALARQLETPEGVEQLRKILYQSINKEYRAPM